MYTSDALHFGRETDCRRDEYETITGAYLDHSCEFWVIGGRKEIEALIADLRKIMEENGL